MGGGGEGARGEGGERGRLPPPTGPLGYAREPQRTAGGATVGEGMGGRCGDSQPPLGGGDGVAAAAAGVTVGGSGGGGDGGALRPRCVGHGRVTRTESGCRGRRLAALYHGHLFRSLLSAGPAPPARSSLASAQASRRPLYPLPRLSYGWPADALPVSLAGAQLARVPLPLG